MRRDKSTILIFVFGALLAAAALGLSGRQPTGVSTASATTTTPFRSPAPPLQVGTASGTASPTRSAASSLPSGTGSDTLGLSLTLSDAGLVPDGSGETYLRVHVAPRVPAKALTEAPVNLVVALDASGSMAGSKMDDAKEATLRLVEQLSDRDTFSLVVYEDFARLVVPPTRADAEGKRVMVSHIRAITPGASTNISDALEKAAAAVASARFDGPGAIVLISDGRANQGVVSRDGLAALARRLREQRVTITTVGVGTDFDHHVMSDIAEAGAGDYHYLRDAAELAVTLSRQKRAAGHLVATEARLQLKLAPGVQLVDLYGLRFELQGDTVIMPLPDFYAGAGRQQILRLRVPTGRTGAVAVAEGRVLFTDLLRDGSPQVADAPLLTAEITSDRARIEALHDRETAVEAIRMQTGAAMRDASALFENGKREEARRKIEEASASLQAANATYASTELSGLGKALRGLFAPASAGVLGGDTEAEYRHQVKATARSLSNMGATTQL